MNNNISFTSRIRLVPLEEYTRLIFPLNQRLYAKPPWTVNQSVLADSAYTKDILDCTVCGITDGQKVLLNHICPTNPANDNFGKIADFIRSKIDLTGDYIQGFLLGSKEVKDSPNSTKLFDKFVEFLNSYNVPFSQFKGGPYENHVAYFSLKDEWIISNSSVKDRMQKAFKKLEPIFENIFDKVKICDLDEICW